MSWVIILRDHQQEEPLPPPNFPRGRTYGRADLEDLEKALTDTLKGSAFQSAWAVVHVPSFRPSSIVVDYLAELSRASFDTANRLHPSKLESQLFDNHNELGGFAGLHLWRKEGS